MKKKCKRCGKQFSVTKETNRREYCRLCAKLNDQESHKRAYNKRKERNNELRKSKKVNLKPSKYDSQKSRGIYDGSLYGVVNLSNKIGGPPRLRYN